MLNIIAYTVLSPGTVDKRENAMKSQDILILLKLVSLENQAKRLQKNAVRHDSELHGWEGWEIDGGIGVSESDADYELEKALPFDRYSARGLASRLGVSKTECLCWYGDI